MSEFIEILDLNDTPIAELSTLDSVRRFSGLTWRTMAGRGYADGSFKITRDIAKYLALKLAYRVKVWDSGKLVYEGRVRGIDKALRGASETITIPMSGFYSILEERNLRWRWVDNAAIAGMVEPASRLTNENQNRLDGEFHDNIIRVRGGFTDTSRAGTESWYLDYPKAPISGNYIQSCEYEIYYRSGEGVGINLYNIDQSAIERSDTTSDGSNHSVSVDETLTGGDTTSIEFRFNLTAADLYDENDRMQVHDLLVNFAMSSFPSPNYYADEIIQDILEMKASEISSDYDDLDSPALVIIPFVVETEQPCSRTIEMLTKFGDGSQNTWGFFIWGSFGTSDDKPKSKLMQRPATTDWEYEASLFELSDFQDSEDIDAIQNYFTVRWVDTDGREQWLTPDDDGDLKNTNSISDYGQRDGFEDAGKSDEATAKEMATRRLAYRKDPKRRTSFGLQGAIKKKGSPVYIPVNQIQAWERIKILDYNDGEVFLIGSTQYDADRRRILITGEEPLNTVEVFLAQQKAGLI